MTIVHSVSALVLMGRIAGKKLADGADSEEPSPGDLAAAAFAEVPRRSDRTACLDIGGAEQAGADHEGHTTVRADARDRSDMAGLGSRHCGPLPAFEASAAPSCLVPDDRLAFGTPRLDESSKRESIES